jgi:hypothetical protein
VTTPELAGTHLTRQELVLGWFHRYPARFAAEVVAEMFTGISSRARRPVTTVLDPFCGTASTVSAARQLGLDAIGIELTTLGTQIGQLRLDPPDDPLKAAAYCELLASVAPAREPELVVELVDWLGLENALLLTAWRSELEAIEDLRLKRFATLALSQSLRPSSRWLVGSVKATSDPERTPVPLRVSLPRWSRQLARDCIAERDAVLARHGRSAARVLGAVLQGDARALPFRDESVDAIITSPPYFVT